MVNNSYSHPNIHKACSYFVCRIKLRPLVILNLLSFSLSIRTFRSHIIRDLYWLSYFLFYWRSKSWWILVKTSEGSSSWRTYQRRKQVESVAHTTRERNQNTERRRTNTWINNLCQGRKQYNMIQEILITEEEQNSREWQHCLIQWMPNKMDRNGNVGGESFVMHLIK